MGRRPRHYRRISHMPEMPEPSRNLLEYELRITLASLVPVPERPSNKEGIVVVNTAQQCIFFTNIVIANHGRQLLDNSRVVLGLRWRKRPLMAVPTPGVGSFDQICDCAEVSG